MDRRCAAAAASDRRSSSLAKLGRLSPAVYSSPKSSSSECGNSVTGGSGGGGGDSFYNPRSQAVRYSPPSPGYAYEERRREFWKGGREYVGGPGLDAQDQGYHTLMSQSPDLPALTTPIRPKSGKNVNSNSNNKKVTGTTTTTTTMQRQKAQALQQQQQPQRCYPDLLPDDVLLEVFGYLYAKDLCLASAVCRRWYRLAWHQSLWQSIVLNGEGVCGDKAVKCVSSKLRHRGGLRSVRRLQVSDGAKISDRGLNLMSMNTALTHVQLHYCPQVTDSAICHLVTHCPNIRHLDLTGCSLVSCVTTLMKASDAAPKKLALQYLDLTDCSVQDASLSIILRNCPQITHLYLRRCSRITDAAVKYISDFCPSLRELSVSDCAQVTDFALYELAKLGSNLRYLSVAKCGRISDSGLKVVAKKCYKLRYLNVRGCEAVSDDAVAAVAQSCPRLRALDIGKCDVTDAGLKAVAESCPNLKKLSVRNCDAVTDKGVQHVCYYCRGLQQLNIQDCRITLEGYKAVKRFCKRCVIEHTNPAFF